MKINFQKCFLYGPNEQVEYIQEWATLLSCKVGTTPFQYLGASIGSSPSSVSYRDPLVQKLKSKLELWDADHLSMAGRLVLIKASADNIPVYWLNLHYIPTTTVTNAMEKLRRQFLWGNFCSVKRKLHLLSWNRVCQKKEIGGLGIVPFREKNLALLAKWWCRTYSKRDKFWNRFLSQRYGVCFHQNLSSIRVDLSPSHMIKSVANLKNEGRVFPLINSVSFKRSLGNRNSIYFWENH